MVIRKHQQFIWLSLNISKNISRQQLESILTTPSSVNNIEHPTPKPKPRPKNRMPATAPAPAPIPTKLTPTPAKRPEKSLSMHNGCKPKIIENS